MTSAEASTPQEPLNERPTLELVPSLDLDQEKAQRINEDIVIINQNLLDHVPSTPEEAREHMEGLKQYASTVKQTEKGYEAEGHILDGIQAEKLLDNADQGTNLWKLTEEAKQTAQDILSAPSYKSLAPELRADAQRLRQSPNDSNKVLLERYQKLTESRVRLDAALVAEETGQTTEAPVSESKAESAQADKKRPGSIGGVKTRSQMNPESSKTDAPIAGDNLRGGTSTANKRDNIADIVKVDGRGKGHRQDGKFLSNYEMDQIEDHADLIRDGIPNRNPGDPTPPEEPTVPAPAEPTPPEPPEPPVPTDPIVPIPPVSGPGVLVPREPNLPAPRSTELVPVDDDELAFMREFPQDMAFDLATALNDYTKLTAARERSIADPNATQKQVEAARVRYEELRRDSKMWTFNKMKELGVEPGDAVMISKLEDKTDAKLAGLGIKFDAERLSEPTGFAADTRKKFYDWWARQGGGDKFFSKKRLMGTAKKAAVMAAVGVPLGIAAGAAGVFLAGPLAGAAVGAAIGRGVSRGLLRSHIDKRANGKTVAAQNFEKRLADQNARIDTFYEAPTLAGLETMSLTDAYAEGTEKSVNRNRRRVLGGAVLAAIGGAAGAEVAQHLMDGGTPTASKPAIAPQKPVVPRVPIIPKPEITPSAHLSLGHSGDSIWAETVDYAQKHGVKLTEGQKRAVVGKVLKSNGQTWASARDLPIGYKFTLNPAELDEILGKK